MNTNAPSTPRISTAVLMGTIGLATAGFFAPGIAFAAQPDSAHQSVTHQGGTGAVVWAIVLIPVVLLTALRIFLSSRYPTVARALAMIRPYLWFAIAAKSLVGLVIDVCEGRPFTAHLILAIVAAYFGALFLTRGRWQDGGAQLAPRCQIR